MAFGFVITELPFSGFVISVAFSFPFSLVPSLFTSDLHLIYSGNKSIKSRILRKLVLALSTCLYKTLITLLDLICSSITSLKSTEYTPSVENQTINSGQYLSGNQVIKGDINLVAGNIKKGISILGVTGILDGGITPSGKIEITNTEEINVTNYETAQVVDSNLIAENIKEGVSILGKVGIEGVESNLGTAIRTVVVIVMSFVMVSVTGKVKEIKRIDKKELVFILLSGISTGASWLFYYRALQDGEASIVVPIDKLSILVTIAFSYFVFKEKLGKKALIGLVLIVMGTLVLLIK